VNRQIEMLERNSEASIEKGTVLWFSPYAALWDSSKLELKVAASMSDAGYNITRVSCTGILDSFCHAMSSEGLSVDSMRRLKASICHDCRANSIAINNSLEFSSLVNLDQNISKETLQSIANLVDTVDKKNYEQFVVDDLPVGKYSTYLSLLHHKTESVTDTDESWVEYLNDLKNALICLSAIKGICKVGLPEYLLVYNPLYPSNRIVTEFLTNLGVKLISVSAGGLLPNRFDTLNIFPTISSSQTIALSESISRGVSIPLTDVEETRLDQHLYELTQGKDPWVYSSLGTGLNATQVKDLLGVRTESTVITVLLSSPDESRASVAVEAEYLENLGLNLSKPAEFLESVITAAKELPHFDFIVRVHPRMLPNKREQVVSTDLNALLAILETRSPNVFLNVPEQNLSIYEVIEITDVALNHTSSAGLEFLGQGIPVVHYDPDRLGIYPYSFGLNVNRGERIAPMIQVAARAGKSELNIEAARGWWATVLMRASVDLSSLSINPVPVQNTIPSYSETHFRLKSLVKWVIPRRMIEKAARAVQRRQRLSNGANIELSAIQRDEIVHRIQALDYGEVWEPQIIVRGETK
jgi:hypothetical protein